MQSVSLWQKTIVVAVALLATCGVFIHPATDLPAAHIVAATVAGGPALMLGAAAAVIPTAHPQISAVEFTSSPHPAGHDRVAITCSRLC